MGQAICRGIRRLVQGTWWGGALVILFCGVSACGVDSSDSSSRAATSTSGEDATEPAGQTSIVESLSSMSKGDLLLVDLSSGSATIDFSGASEGAQYQLVVQSTATAAGSASVTVGDVSAGDASALLKSAVVDRPLAAQAYVDDRLRQIEHTLQGDPIAPSFELGKGVTKAIAVGNTATFRVLTSLSTVTAYKSVTATLKCVEKINRAFSVAFYVDDAVSSAFTGEQISTLCTQYAGALATEFSILGDPPDINNDDAVAVLATKVVNEIGGSLGGIVTGFFFGGDLLARSSSNPASNEQEVIYKLVPDPTGQYGTEIATDFALNNLLPAVVPHEVQHMMSYYRHVIDKKSSAEVSWLNEAMSHLVEDVVGHGQENPSRIELFLVSMHDTALITSGSPGLEERGASYLFLRYLYEQASSSNAFLRAVLDSSETGVTNVVAAFNGQFAAFDEWNEFLLRWGVALAVTNQNVTTDSRYIYATRSQHSGTGHWQGVCLKCTTDDGRDTVLVGPTSLSASGAGSVSIYAGANAIYDLLSPPASLTIQPSGSNLQGILIRTN